MSNVQRGFTLIESLVAVALFVLVVTAALGLFLTYSKAQKETGLRQKAINQLNLEIEKIAKDIRLNKIVFIGAAVFWGGNLYELDGTGENPFITGKEKDLAFEDGSRYFFIAGETNPKPTGLSCYGYIDNTQANTSGYLYKYSGSQSCEPLFMISEIKLIDVGFYISPSYNPYPTAGTHCLSGTFNGYYCECSGDTQCGTGVAGTGLCVEGFCYVSQPSVTISVTAQIGSDTNNTVTLQTTVSSRVYQ